MLIVDTSKGLLQSSVKYKYNFPLQDVNVVPENILLVEELCDIISELFPDLWKLGQAYFTGELHVKFESGRQTEFKVLVVFVKYVCCQQCR